MDWIGHFEGIAQQSPWLAIILSFAGGVLASFTPCTYPMMPITVAFIGGKANGSKKRGFLLSIFYVLGMSLVYSALAIFAALTGQFFGSITASPWTYLIVGNICLFFGLVMLEAVPLAPPGFLNNLKITGFSGHDVFTSMILGGASALVVSTCTTPILGVLLALVAAKHQIALGMGMLFSFSVGLGALVIVVGTFTGLLTSLPRSGIWMLRVQRVFGILMILAAEYFLIKTGEFLI
ncbi:Cytochrome c biogenesis protein, transmembrane region [Syntrophobacter sp. SbD1]|nr:Cytochrome c biogenesis protein, transmembrane region [Syntrophobacter sp. SbD1]